MGTVATHPATFRVAHHIRDATVRACIVVGTMCCRAMDRHAASATVATAKQGCTSYRIEARGDSGNSLQSTTRFGCPKKDASKTARDIGDLIVL